MTSKDEYERFLEEEYYPGMRQLTACMIFLAVGIPLPLLIGLIIKVLCE